MELSGKELTLEIVEYLDNQGYTYFLSKPAKEVGETAIIPILPIKHNPEDLPLPAGFDGYYNIKEQGYEMGRGVDTVLFELSILVFFSVRM